MHTKSRIGTTAATLAFTLLLALSAATPHAAEETASNQYRIESAVWCEGELRGQPRLTLAPGARDSFEISARDNRWRLTVEVEPPAQAEGAAPESLWLKVDIEQWLDGEWEFLTDTIIGTPLGRPGKITVMGASDEDSTPDRAPLYVEMVASRIE